MTETQQKDEIPVEPTTKLRTCGELLLAVLVIAIVVDGISNMLHVGGIFVDLLF